MKIAIIGSGYVGLVTGVCFAHCGHEVTFVDTDAGRLADIEAGRCPISEPGLAELLHRSKPRISIGTYADAVRCQFAFICVGTPRAKDGPGADLSAVYAAATAIRTAHLARPLPTMGEKRTPVTVVIKSTVPPGTNVSIAGEVFRGIDIEVISNPEFLKEGDAVRDCLRPDRVVIGGRPSTEIDALYAPLVRSHEQIIWMDPTSAELTKYATNGMLATRISFMNELAQLADAVGADIERVRVGLGSDSRIGSAFLYAGIGWGGSCFPKDTRALVHVGHERQIHMNVVAAAVTANHYARRFLLGKIREHVPLGDKRRRVALWGLAFKPETDDVRESPGVWLANQLRKDGYEVVAHDPDFRARANAQAELEPGVVLSIDQYESLVDADAVVLCTEWRQLRTPDFARMADLMKQIAYVFDGRNVYNPDYVRAQGFGYVGIGRP